MIDEEKRADAQPEPQPPATEAVPEPAPSVEPGPFDSLIISPEEAKKIEEQRATAAAVEPEEVCPEEEEDVTLLPEQIERICKAMDRLARKGLNLRAIVALLHDAHPAIPKKHIKAVLEGLRELPAIYGK
jgi:hypothetical protein